MKLLDKIEDFFFKIFVPTCDPPYDCPWCMECYNYPSEIDER